MMIHALIAFAAMTTAAACPERGAPKGASSAKRTDGGTVARMTRYAARDVGIPARLALAVMLAESGGRSDALSPSCAKGPMQLLSGTAKEWGARDVWNPRQNVTAGVRYLAWLRARYRGSLPLTLAAYNAGPGAVDRYGGIPPFAETRRYVPAVLAMCCPRDRWTLPERPNRKRHDRPDGFRRPYETARR